MTSEEALKEIDKMRQVALHDWDNPDDEYQANTYNALCLAGDALEKQIPKRGEKIWDIPCCPSCGLGQNKEFTFCPSCGQRLDWRADDE